MKYRWLQEALDGGAEIVTATNRLARELRATHARGQIDRGVRAWPTPSVLPWSAWLRAALAGSRASVDEPLCLETAASAVLWESALREEAGDRWLNVAGLARQMQHSWQRLQQWRVPVAELVASAASDDQRLFAAVAQRYERQLAVNGWIDATQLAARLTLAVQRGTAVPPRLLIYAGFERPAPDMRALFEELAAAGCELRPAPLADRRRALAFAATPDADAELRAAGAWVERQLAANPAGRIAIVRASLENDAARCSRLVREGLAPGWQYGDGPRREAVNVSYGRRLSDYPMIAIAMLWLKWVHRGLESREVGMLLRSPFTASASRDARYRLETAVRSLPDRSWTPVALRDAFAGERDARAAADWMKLLEQVAAMARQGSEPASPADWANRIDAFLAGLGWPGNRPLDSNEFQLQNRWRELLNELSMLQPVRPRLRFREAFARLASLAADVVFQPETAEGMVQLLGPLEAAGLEFDAIWVANLDATQWPPAAWPLPLVSRTLQRKAGMPDAIPGDTLERARHILDRIAASADSVVMSWPVAEHDIELVRSPLLDAYRADASPAMHDPGWFASGIRQAAKLCREPHDPVPPVAPGERVRGGAHTVQCQFEEPFAAFAIGRLGVRRLQTFEQGLSAGLRGRILHHALGVLMQDKPTREDLRQWAGEQLARRIDRSIDTALREPALHADPVGQRLLALERTRLRRVLHMFVASEIGRPAFSVEAIESALSLERHGVSLELRVDRIDRLGDGSLLIIDYKSGAVRNILGADGGPSEWQTIVYASALDQRVGGLVLVNLDSRAIVYRGTGKGGPWRPLEAGEWRRRLEEWSRLVDDAIARLAAGDARIDMALAPGERRGLSLLSRAEVLKRAG